LDDDAWRIEHQPAAPVTPLPFRARREVERALRSPPDSFGVPSELYKLDPLLTAYRREMDAQARARRSVGIGHLIGGAIFGGLSAWAILAGRENVNSTDPDVRSSANQAIVYG